MVYYRNTQTTAYTDELTIYTNEFHLLYGVFHLKYFEFLLYITAYCIIFKEF